MLLVNMLTSQTIFSIYQQEKERIGINSRASTKMLLLKIPFRYQISHLYCLNCLGSMLVWFLDAFNNFWTLHPTARVCRHCATNSQFSCTYLQVSRRSVSLISLVSLTRFQAMPSMSYELVAGADITCGSWMFSACRCWKSYRRVWFLGCRRCSLWDCIWPRKPHMTSAHVMVWGHLYNFRISDWLKMAICMLVYLIHIWYFKLTTSFPHISSTYCMTSYALMHCMSH